MWTQQHTCFVESKKLALDSTDGTPSPLDRNCEWISGPWLWNNILVLPNKLIITLNQSTVFGTDKRVKKSHKNSSPKMCPLWLEKKITLPFTSSNRTDTQMEVIMMRNAYTDFYMFEVLVCMLKEKRDDSWALFCAYWWFSR